VVEKKKRRKREISFSFSFFLQINSWKNEKK